MHEGFDIAGKTALVTGGTSGLGKAIALAMARAGARVYAASRDEAKVDAARRELLSISSQCGAIVLDVTEPVSIDEGFDGVASTTGSLDIVVNAAGITHRSSALDMPLDDWNRVLQVNLTGTFLCCQTAGRIMVKLNRGGVILNIASLASYRGWSLVASYGASKAAVVELTQTLAVEWAEHSIRVNAIAPGVFPTPLNRTLIEGTPRGAWFKSHSAMNRFGDPNELTGAAIFLCSPAASFITGETLAVDGGYLACGVPVSPPGAY